MPLASTSQIPDVVARRLALVRSLRERLRDDQDDEPLTLQEEIGHNLWLFGPDFDSRVLKVDPGITKHGARFFADVEDASSPNATASQRSVGFYSRWASNPFHPGHGIARLVIVLLSRSDIRPGQAERSMIWQCVKHLRSLGRSRRETPVVGFVLGHLFEIDEHEKVQLGAATEIRPAFFHPMLDAAEHRLNI